jgi:hypothetical protein
LPALDDASLTSIVATLRDQHAGLFAQPSAPTRLPLWWQLGTTYYTVVPTDDRPHALIGVTGSGKTRAMYELLSTRFGFYWTCSVARNGGARLVDDTVDKLAAVNNAAVVDLAVDHLLMIFAVLFLAWREINPTGTALEWLVFQTTNVGLEDVLLANERGNVDRAADTVEALLKFKVCKESVAVALAAMRRKTPMDHIVVVVDEAQVLANLRAVFASSQPNRAALSAWAKRLQSYSDAGVVWWLAGTSLSLRHVNDIAGSAGDKSDGGPRDFKRLTPLAFGEFDAFEAYLKANVPNIAFNEVTLLELFDMFRGRARPVANLARRLRALSPAATHDDIVNVGKAHRADILDPTIDTSFVYHVVRRLSTPVYEKHKHEFHTALQHLLRGSTRDAARSVSDYIDLFEAGIGYLESAVNDDCVVAEPMAMAALFVAFCKLDSHGRSGLSPMMHQVQTMALNPINATLLSFLAEQVVAPFIHLYFINNYNALFGGVQEAPLPFYSLLHCDHIDEGLKNMRDGLFAPKVQAHPDCIHTIASNFGLLGQVKFTRDTLGAADWAHAVRTTSKDALFMQNADPASGIIAGFDDERNAALAAMRKRWTGGYASYVFTLAEPPAGIQFKQKLEDGRWLFVFSPKLCENLFAGLNGVDVWTMLRHIKLPSRRVVSVALATVDDILAIKPNFATASKAIAYRDELAGQGVSANELWGRITNRFWSLKKFERPEWLVD